jgi:lysophospholipase L1-like esterase
VRKRSIVTLVLAAGVAATGLVTTSGVGQAAQQARTKAALPYYLSLGDSYSIGYQPGLPGGGGSPGYTAVVAKKEKLQLENFGCGGATTNSILWGFPDPSVPGSGTAAIPTPGCGDYAATDAVQYPTQTQEQAALSFIGTPANFGKVAAVTVSISGNDVTACAGAANAITCVLAAKTAIVANVTQLATDLRSALDTNGDSTAKVIGLTYPDVILAATVNPGGAGTATLATESVAAFDDIINPALSAAYTGVAHGGFVNVTSAPYKKATAGDDSSATPLVKLAPYGALSPAVWEICKLTYYCSQQNIHANSKGYAFIGGLIVTAYPGI